MGNSTHLRGGAYGDVGHALLRLELLSADWVEGAQLREVLKQRRPLVRKACQPHGTLALNKLLLLFEIEPPLADGLLHVGRTSRAAPVLLNRIQEDEDQSQG